MPALLIDSWGDPATPDDGALAVRRLMPQSRLVTPAAGHHTVLGEYPSRCVEEAAVRYLVQGQIQDRFCGAEAMAGIKRPPRMGMLTPVSEIVAR